MKRIAFLGRGGHTLPTYRALLNRIAEHPQLSLYSEVALENDWSAFRHKYRIRAVSLRDLPRRLRVLGFLWLLIREHLREPFDVVHAHSTYATGFVAVIMQKSFGIPAIVSLHAAEGSALKDIHFGDLLSRKRTIINRWVINHARVATSLSTFQSKEVRKNLAIRRDITVIPRGVDLNRFYYERKNDIGSPVVFLSVGYLNPIKDPETLLQVLTKIQRTVNGVLVVIGKDCTDESIQHLARELGISEFVSHDLIAGYYRNADALLHKSRYESESVVIGKAMAAGVLVCGSNVGILSDLSGECRIAVPVQKPDELADAVLSLLKDKDRMHGLRQRAYAWSVRNSLERTAKRIMSLHDQSIKNQ